MSSLAWYLAAMMADRHGRPLQQGSLRFRHGGHRSRQLRCDGSRDDRRHDPAHVPLRWQPLLFKEKFTKEEREAGPTNFIMGLAFITEGAIPFAASDPAACAAGLPHRFRAVAGGHQHARSSCTLMAPHGGIFVFPVVGTSAWMYLLALVVGHR